MNSNSEFTLGQTLLVELSTNECFVGKLKLSGKNYIELDNIYCVDKNEPLDGSQLFFRSDILSIKAYQDEICTKQPSNDNLNINDETDPQNPEITVEELKEIENRLNNVIYIFQTDRLYHEAIKDLSKQEIVSVSLESCRMGRHTETDVLTFGTKEHIYIFDIRLLGRIHPELRCILQGNKPRKILHDGRKIADSLYFKHNINISSVFDTLVAHVGTGGGKNITDLNGCIQKYLKVPSSFFYDDKDTNWHERPLDQHRKAITAKKVIFIDKLHNILLHKYLLRDFYKTCNNFVNVYRQNLDFTEVACDMVSTHQSSLETINDIDLDLSSSVDGLNSEE